MAGEAGTDDTVDTVVVEGSATDDADFDSGFSESEQTTTPAAPAATQDDKPTVEAAAPAPEPPPKLAEITEAQYQELLAKAGRVETLEADAKTKFDTAFGQIGGLKQVVDAMRAATPSGQAVELTDDDFADMQKDYPELSDALKPFLKKALSKFKGTAPDAAVIEQIVNQRLEAPLATFTKLTNDRLNDIVPEWETVVKTDEFKDWWNKQDEKTKALGAGDSADCAKALRLFRDRPKDPPKPAPAPPAAPAVTTRQRTLSAAAANPKSAGAISTAKSADDEFDEGFRSP